MSKGKYLAIDYGDRRVGIAISDLNKEIAFPREFLAYKSADDLIARIGELCRQEPVVKIIIGLPIEMDGKAGERVKKTYQFGQKLAAAFPSVAIEYFDERLTTQAAEKKLRQIGVKARDQKGEKDAIAAQLILETYLHQLK